MQNPYGMRVAPVRDGAIDRMTRLPATTLRTPRESASYMFLPKSPTKSQSESLTPTKSQSESLTPTKSQSESPTISPSELPTDLPTKLKTTSCITSLRERFTSPPPARSIKYVRESLTVDKLRAQLELRGSGSSLKVEFLVHDSVFFSESDWCKACVLRVGPEGLVDVKVLSGNEAGKIVKNIPLRRLRGTRRITATMQFFYVTLTIGLVAMFLLLLPVIAFRRVCPLMNSRHSDLDAPISAYANLSGANKSSDHGIERVLPIEFCAASSDGDRMLKHWLSGPENKVLIELEETLCRIDPDAFFSMETPRPTIEGCVLLVIANVVGVTYWVLVSTASTIPPSLMNWAMLIWYEFFWLQALLLLPFLWPFWHRRFVAVGHIHVFETTTRWIIIGYTISAVYVVFATFDAQMRYSQLLAWLVGRVKSANDATPCADGWRWSVYGDIDYFHEGQRAVGPWEFTMICSNTLQRVRWCVIVAASFGTPFYLGICAFFLSTMHTSIYFWRSTTSFLVGFIMCLVYICSGLLQQILFMANGSMPRPVAMYNEASVPTALSTGVFLVHMGVVVIGIALVYQAPYTIFALKRIMHEWHSRDSSRLTTKLTQETVARTERLDRQELLAAFIPLKDSPEAAVLLKFEKKLDFEISLEVHLEAGKLTRKLAAKEHMLFEQIGKTVQGFVDNAKGEDYLWMLQTKYIETAAPHRRLYEDALNAIRGHSGKAFDSFVEEADGLAEFLKKDEPSVQTTRDPCQLLADARHVKPVFDVFIEAVASKSAGNAMHAKIKGRYRIGEKIALRPPHEKQRYPGACRVRDAVRGAIIYNRMSELAAGFNLIVGSDAATCNETYSAAEAAGLNTRIILRGVKNRFGNPTTAGWADCMVTFSFLGDAEMHICEVQLIHNEMMTVRRECGAHRAYSTFRTAAELLEAGEHELPQIKIQRRSSLFAQNKSENNIDNIEGSDEESFDGKVEEVIDILKII